MIGRVIVRGNGSVSGKGPDFFHSESTDHGQTHPANEDDESVEIEVAFTFVFGLLFRPNDREHSQGFGHKDHGSRRFVGVILVEVVELLFQQDFGVILVEIDRLVGIFVKRVLKLNQVKFSFCVKK